MRNITLATILAVVLALSSVNVLAQDRPAAPKSGSSKLYWTSVVFSAAGTAFDTGTSWGRLELNPIMRSRDGRFGARAVGLKVVVPVGIVVVQRRFFKRHQKAMAVANLAAGSLWFVVGGVTVARP